MEHMAKKGKMVLKMWFLRGKMWMFGLEELRTNNQTRKLKWCKMQVFFLKVDISKDMKSLK